MSSPYSLKVGEEQAREMPMVDLAFEVLKAANTPFYYRDLMTEIARIKGLTDDQVMQVIAQLYTEINIDGRFACVGQNLWGLKRWYPVEKSDDAVGSGKRPRIINDEDDDLDEEEYVEEEDTFAEDGFDDFAKGDDFEEDVEEEAETPFFAEEELDEEEGTITLEDEEDGDAEDEEESFDEEENV